MPENLLFSIKVNVGVCLDGIKQSFAENSTIVANLIIIQLRMNQLNDEVNGYIA